MSHVHFMLYRLKNVPRKAYGELLSGDNGNIHALVRKRAGELADKYFTEVKVDGLYDLTQMGALPEHLQFKHGVAAYDELNVRQLLPIFLNFMNGA